VNRGLKHLVLHPSDRLRLHEQRSILHTSYCSTIIDGDHKADHDDDDHDADRSNIISGGPSDGVVVDSIHDNQAGSGDGRYIMKRSSSSNNTSSSSSSSYGINSGSGGGSSRINVVIGSSRVDSRSSQHGSVYHEKSHISHPERTQSAAIDLDVITAATAFFRSDKYLHNRRYKINDHSVIITFIITALSSLSSSTIINTHHHHHHHHYYCHFSKDSTAIAGI